MERLGELGDAARTDENLVIAWFTIDSNVLLRPTTSVRRFLGVQIISLPPTDSQKRELFVKIIRRENQ